MSQRPLTSKQKAKLAQLARRAYDHAAELAPDSPLPDFDTWRRQQIFAACGRAGLRACENRHFNLVAAHFHSLLGEDGTAFNELVAAGTEWRRSAEVVLLREMESAGLDQAYAESISRSRFGKNLMDTSDSEFAQLLSTVKARVRAKRRQQQTAKAA